MPVSLHDPSRRNFLQGLVALGAGATPALGALTSPAASTDDRLCLLSDVHVSGGFKGVMASRLTRAIDQVLSLPRRPEKVLIAGDCAYLRGKREDYRQYVRVIRPLVASGLPLHMILGNHDDRDHFWDALPPEYCTSATGIGRQASIVCGRQADWYLLDSLGTTNHGPGELGSDQIGWLAASLDAHAHKPAIIMLHHNPERDYDRGSLKDSEQLMAAVRPRRNVKAMFFGHTHIWSVTRDSSGIHMVNLPATGYTLFFRSFLGWVDCRVGDRGAALRVHALKQGDGEDGRVVQLAWRA